MSHEKEQKNGKESELIGNIAKILKAPKGKINIQVDGKPAISLDFKGNNVDIDIQDAGIFSLTHVDDDDGQEDVGLLDKLKTAKTVAQIFDDNDITLSVLRKGKKAFTLGKEAHPTLSRILSRSDDIQINSVKQAAKLGRDMQKAHDHGKKK
jgi:hypothetical protein